MRRRTTFAVVMASLLVVGGCTRTFKHNEACNAAFGLANNGADSAFVYRHAPSCADYTESWTREQTRPYP